MKKIWNRMLSVLVTAAVLAAAGPAVFAAETSTVSPETTAAAVPAAATSETAAETTGSSALQTTTTAGTTTAGSTSSAAPTEAPTMAAAAVQAQGSGAALTGSVLDLTAAGGSFTVTQDWLSANSLTHLTVSGTGTLVLDNVSLAPADDGASALALAAGANVKVVVRGACSLTGARNGAGLAVPAGAALVLTGEDAAASLTAAGNAQKQYNANYAGNTAPAADAATSGCGIGSAGADTGFGSITVQNLASLTARGYGLHACGIGGSGAAGSDSIITITGSTVAAYGGFEQEAIATGDGKHDAEGGPAIGAAACAAQVVITNSTITAAHGGSKAAAIGAGFWNPASVTITGSTLTDIVGGSTSAGIGTSRSGGTYNNAASITITDSTVTVRGGALGAGIGTGINSDSRSATNGTPLPVSTVSIAGSSVTAVGGQGGAGIGGGYKGHNVNVAIDGTSTVLAQGVPLTKYYKTASGSYARSAAAGIGSGANGSNALTAGPFEGGTISIAQGANVVALSVGGVSNQNGALSKWAIDNTNSGSTATVLQMNFLDNANNAGTLAAEKGYTAENAVIGTDTLLLDTTKQNTVQVGTHTVTLPAGYLCVAATQSAAGTFSVLSADMTPQGASYVQSAAPLAVNPDFAGTAGIASFDYVAFRPAAQPTTTTATTATTTTAATTRRTTAATTVTAATTASAATTAATASSARRATTAARRTTSAARGTTAAVTTAPASTTAVTITEGSTPLGGVTSAEQIDEAGTPLARRGAWALLNLILTLLTALGSIALLITWFTRRQQDDEDSDETQSTVGARRTAARSGSADAEPDADGKDDDRIRRHGLLRILSVLIAIAAVIVFIFTEDMRLPMVFVDRWTLLMVCIFVVQLVDMFFSRKKYPDDDEDDDPDSTRPARA